MIDPLFLASIGVIFLIAGTVKGSIGMGLPTTALGLMTLFIDPRSAIALVLVPMVVTNAWQLFRSGDVVGAALRYWRFGLALMVGVALTVAASGGASDQILLVSLGLALLLFVLVSVSGWAPQIGERAINPAQYFAGAMGGIIGGLTAVWAPPLAIYLAARRVPKDEFVRASGLLIFLGSLPLAAGFLKQGVLTGPVAIASTAMLVPAMIGFSLGEQLRGKMSEGAFRYFLLIFFSVMGLNLIRRGLT